MKQTVYDKKVKTIEDICYKAETGRGKMRDMERAANLVTWLYTFDSVNRERTLALADRVTDCFENAILE